MDIYTPVYTSKKKKKKKKNRWKRGFSTLFIQNFKKSLILE